MNAQRFFLALLIFPSACAPARHLSTSDASAPAAVTIDSSLFEIEGTPASGNPLRVPFEPGLHCGWRAHIVTPVPVVVWREKLDRPGANVSADHDFEMRTRLPADGWIGNTWILTAKDDSLGPYQLRVWVNGELAFERAFELAPADPAAPLLKPVPPGTVFGSLDPAIIDAEIKSHLRAIQGCYERELDEFPKLNGKLIMHFIIESDGTVSSAGLKSTTMNFPRVEHCIEAVFLSIRFTTPRGGGIVTVNYPLLFKSAD